MSKAVLIMDMPESCDVCEFVEENCSCGILTCINPLSEQYGCEVTDYIECRADGCPLKPMPDKKNRGEETATWKMGYNACIDEILGEGTE